MDERQTILLVDDNEDDLFLLREAFHKADFNNPLQQVDNGEKAIAYLNGEGAYSDRTKFPLPTAMLLDLNMPTKNGFEVMEWLRTQPGLRHVTVIILTASVREEDVEKAFDLGANSYLVKPPTVAKLATMIRCLRDWLQINHFPPLNESVRR